MLAIFENQINLYFYYLSYLYVGALVFCCLYCILGLVDRNLKNSSWILKKDLTPLKVYEWKLNRLLIEVWFSKRQIALNISQYQFELKDFLKGANQKNSNFCKVLPKLDNNWANVKQNLFKTYFHSFYHFVSLEPIAYNLLLITIIPRAGVFEV